MKGQDDIQKVRDLLMQIALKQTPIRLRTPEQYNVIKGQVDALTWVLDNGQAPGKTFEKNLKTVKGLLEKMGYIQTINSKDPRQN